MKIKLYNTIYILAASAILSSSCASGSSGFGYILKKGNTYSFVQHDMPDGVISSACDFFGLEVKEQHPDGN